MLHADAALKHFKQRAEQCGADNEVEALLAEIEAITSELHATSEATAAAPFHEPTRIKQKAHHEPAAACVQPPRPALPARDEAAAEKLTAAQALLNDGNYSQSACLLHVESLILSERLEDAAAELQQLPASVDKTYLHAEIMVRRGELEEACRLLAPASVQPGTAPLPHAQHGTGLQRPPCTSTPSSKCSDLLATASALLSAVSAAQARLDGGDYQQCLNECGQTLAWVDKHLPHGGVRQRLLLLEAQAMLALPGQEQAAVQVLQKAVDLGPKAGPKTAQALWLLAHTLMRTGDAEQAFEHLHVLRGCDPSYPGLAAALQHAAQAALHQQQHPQEANGSYYDPKVQESCRLLGLESRQLTGLRRTDLERLYRRRAAECHPDKQQPGVAGQKDAGAERFIAIRQAFEQLAALTIDN